MMAVESVDQLGRQRLDPTQVTLGNLGHAGAVFRIGLIKEGQDDVLALVISAGQGTAEAVDQVLALLLTERTIQIAGLLEVLLTGNLCLLGAARQGCLAVTRDLRLVTRQQAAWLVIHAAGAGPAVHGAVLITVVYGNFWRIDRQLQCIGAQAIRLGIGIREHSTLQQTVFRWLDTGHQISGRHGNLFGFLKDIFRITVQDHLSNFSLCNTGPDLGGVQWIEIKLVQVLWLYHLNVQVPLGEVAFIDMRYQVIGHMTVILTLNFYDSLWIEIVDPLQTFPVKLYI